MSKENIESSGLSRRSFLKGGTIAASASRPRPLFAAVKPGLACSWWWTECFIGAPSLTCSSVAALIGLCRFGLTAPAPPLAETDGLERFGLAVAGIDDLSSPDRDKPLVSARIWQVSTI